MDEEKPSSELSHENGSAEPKLLPEPRRFGGHLRTDSSHRQNLIPDDDPASNAGLMIPDPDEVRPRRHRTDRPKMQFPDTDQDGHDDGMGMMGEDEFTQGFLVNVVRDIADGPIVLHVREGRDNKNYIVDDKTKIVVGRDTPGTQDDFRTNMTLRYKVDPIARLTLVHIIGGIFNGRITDITDFENHQTLKVHFEFRQRDKFEPEGVRAAPGVKVKKK